MKWVWHLRTRSRFCCMWDKDYRRCLYSSWQFVAADVMHLYHYSPVHCILRCFVNFLCSVYCGIRGECICLFLIHKSTNSLVANSFKPLSVSRSFLFDWECPLNSCFHIPLLKSKGVQSRFRDGHVSWTTPKLKYHSFLTWLLEANFKLVLGLGILIFQLFN